MCPRRSANNGGAVDRDSAQPWIAREEFSDAFPVVSLGDFDALDALPNLNRCVIIADGKFPRVDVAAHSCSRQTLARCEALVEDCERVCRCLRIVRLNNVKQFSIILLAILAASACGWGNLGDTSDRVDDAYGNLVQRRLHDDGTVSVLYHKDRYLYQVTFADGRSVSETYFHVKGDDFSEKEIAKLLKANGGTWTSEKTANERRFKRSDGGAAATYGTVNGRPALTVREVHAKS